MTENEIAREVVDIAFKMHNKLGPGLLESVYHKIMVYELHKRGLAVEAERPIQVVWDDLVFDIGFRADIVVENLVIIELKSVEETSRLHKKQLVTYLRLADKRLGLLINFGAELIRDGISRVVNQLAE